jgi:putative addiction module component (TIGR02574 family)
MESLKHLAEKAISLKPIDRIQLVETILLSLDKPDPDIERLWAKESDERFEAYKRGELKAREWDEIKKRYKC